MSNVTKADTNQEWPTSAGRVERRRLLTILFGTTDVEWEGASTVWGSSSSQSAREAIETQQDKPSLARVDLDPDVLSGLQLRQPRRL